MALPPPDDRYFEDYTVGSVHELGETVVDEAELLAFARRYDPQYIHIDAEQARLGPYGGLIASGWHTCSLMMRLLVDRFVSSRSALGSPGVEAVRWPHPVRPGDRLSGKMAVIEVRRSRSKPDRGIIECHAEMVNQNGVTVLTMKTVMIVMARQPG